MTRLCLAAVGLLMAVCLAAAPAAAGKKDDTLVWATDRDNPIADPFYLNTRELVVIGHHVWDTLVIIDPKTAEIKPLLATKWKWADAVTLELELRKGVKFHSGKELDADDVVYTLNHVSNKDNAIANYALLAWIKEAEKIDASHVRIHLRNPFPPALAYLAGLGFIMQKGHYDGAPVKPDGKKDFGAVAANGTGPYKVTEVKPGDYIMLERNTAYFKGGFKGDPKISKIKFRTVKDGNTRAAELMTGAIDWLWDVPKDQAERIKANPAIVVENAKTLRIAYLAFDVQGASGQKFFTDKRVRQAVAHAIDREAITKNLVGPASAVIHAACHPDQFACAAEGAPGGGGPCRRLRVRHLCLPRARVHRGDHRRSRQGRHQAQAQLRAVYRIPRKRAQGQDADRERHLGLELGAGRLGHHRAFLHARAR
jgi:peptide/nickel transport system substrate-binding protein